MSESRRAKPIKKSSFAGTGCLMQFLGFASCAVGIVTLPTVIGPLIFGPLGLWLLVAGGRSAIWYECSECGSRLARKRVKVCPGCRSPF